VGVILLEPIVNVFHTYKVSANALTVLSLLFAIMASVSYYFSVGSALVMFAALALVFLNALMDGADGLLARKSNSVSKYGDFLDHVIDRYSDVFIIGGACLGGYVDPTIGIIVLTGVLLASYLGTQAQAVGVGRNYGGIMGRADRLVIIILATSLNIAYKPAFGIWGFDYSFIGWALILIGAASHVTALQRVWRTRKILLDDENK
jgi:phosphatidylglycerophosphate synthase